MPCTTPNPVRRSAFRGLGTALGVALQVAVVCTPGSVETAFAESPRSFGTNAIHWAYRPLVEPTVPEGGNGTAGGHPIDRFLATRLRQEGLSPSPEADRTTLLRRVTFDLTGLPPTPADAEAFLKDTAPDAYGRLVDRLLASPRHGERWARHWLDVVHYGETHGYDKDQPRPNAWPYRDYVIRALNADKPYGRFIREQVAGDVLWPDTEDGIAATGFIAAGPWDLIGHAEVPETKTDGKIARMMDRDDMVSTVMNTFASTTIQCARCHDHKFDPVPAEDYYRLTAVFAALDRADRKFDTDPAVAARRKELESRKAGLKRDKESAEAELLKRGGRRLMLLERRIAAAGQSEGKEPARPEFGWHSAIEPKADVLHWVQVDLGTPVDIRSVLLAGCRDDFAGIGDGFGFPKRYRLEASDDPDFRAGVRVLEDRTAEDVPNPGVAPRTVKVEGVRARHVRFTATRLATRSNDHIAALAELEVVDASGANRALGATVTASQSIEAGPRWGRDNLTDGWYPGRTRVASGDELATLRRDRDALRAEAGGGEWKTRLEKVEGELAAVSKELGVLPPTRTVYAGTVHHGGGAFRGTGPDGGKPRPITVLARGDVRKPGKPVGAAMPRHLGGPAIPEVAQELPEGARRVALAEWLADPSNGIVWRSIVNRVWQHHFGRGIVETSNDFGRMGAEPSHPELLEWLAVWFRDHGQSLKSLHRLIVTSAAYRQVSTVAATGNPAVAKDADNRLLWRMNRRKLEAEAVRDSLLAVSGRLDLAMGGPSFQDFVVERPEHSPHYEYRLHDPEDPKSHRRSVYRFLVRSQPQPLMTALDCADPSISVDRRNETLNALQALALMNNRLGVALARHFAARLEREAPAGTADRIRLGFQLALGRAPTPEELETLTDHAERRGLPSACRLLFNLNEFVFVD
jgi:hypothetical protein